MPRDTQVSPNTIDDEPKATVSLPVTWVLYPTAVEPVPETEVVDPTEVEFEELLATEA
jgi:hypothetical protein